MALSLRTALLLLACTASAGVFACSSSGGGGNSTTTSGTHTGGSATTTTTSSGSTSTTTTASCKATMDGGAAACQQCCETAHPAGFAVFEEAALASCACAPSSPCYSACGADAGAPAFCAGPDGGTPSAACDACLQGLGGMSPPPSCLTSAATGTTCSASADCTAFAACGLGC